MYTSAFKGYQEIFPDFVASLKAAASMVQPYGPINIDPGIPAVIRLWTEIKGIIYNINQFMKPFLELFGVEEGNGLSPFSVDTDSPYDPIKLIEYFFRPPKIYLQENPKNKNSTNPSDNGNSEEDADDNYTCNIIPGF